MLSRISLALLLLATAAHAQRGGRFPRGGIDPNLFGSLGDNSGFYTPPDFAGNPKYDGRFTFARIKYRGFGRFSGREGPGWAHDYPDAEFHFMTILKEITVMRPFVKNGAIIGGAIVALDEPDLLKYPFAYLSEPGGWFPNAEEAKGLRNYLLKGGFLMFDDWPGFNYGEMVAGMAKALPELKPIQMTGQESIFDSFFKVDIARVRSEYGRCEGFTAYYEGNDPKKRLLALGSPNCDIGESWQWSGQGFMPVDVTNEAFKIGVNLIIYALTH